MSPTAEFSTIPFTCLCRLYRAHPQATAGTGDFSPLSTRLKWKREQKETFTSLTKWKMPYCELQNSSCFLYALGDLVYRKGVSCLQRCFADSFLYFYISNSFWYEPNIKLNKTDSAQNFPRWALTLFSCFHRGMYLDSAFMTSYLFILSAIFFTNTLSTRCWAIITVVK